MQTGKSTARTSNTDTVSISTRSNSSSYIGQYKYMSDESLDKTINNLKNTIKNSKSGTATYYAQKALEGYEAEKSKRSLSTMLTGSHSENLESYLRGLEKQYGTQYVCDKVFGGDKSKYDPVKRAEQICGINGSRVSDTAMKNRVDEVVNGKNIKICKNNTSLYRKNQVNGNQYNYSFSKDFNAELEKSVNDLVDDVIDGRFSEQEKMYLKKVVPYIVKGIGASESSWSSSKGGFVGLTSDGLNGVDYFNYTFKHNNFSNDLKEYVTPKSGAELSAAMIIHWASYYKQNNTNIENALWLGQVSYCGGESNAAYQLGMANDFYVQDTGDLLFSGVCKSVVLNLEQYGVYSDKNASQLEDVTIYPDRCIRSRCVE